MIYKKPEILSPIPDDKEWDLKIIFDSLHK